MGSENRKVPWWKGTRGEWYVAVQVLLFALVVLGPRRAWGLTSWKEPWGSLSNAAGFVLMIAGGLLSSTAVLRLGRNLTPLPKPKNTSHLITSGPYRLVRHPIYSGLIIAALGWALHVQGIFTIGYALILLLFFDLKTRREEKWLNEKFPEYAAYRRRVRKLIPFVY